MEIIKAITNVFTEIGTWLVSAVNDLIPMFWNATDNSLTLMGILAIMGLGLSVIFF